MAKIKIEDIRNTIEEQGWFLISDSYKSLKEEMIFKCPEGHNVYSTWAKMRNSLICPVCSQNIYKDKPNIIYPKSKGKKRYMALDQASYKTGYSIFDDNKLIDYGVFETFGNNEIERDTEVKRWLISMIQMWKPDLVGVEGIQYQQNMGVTTFEVLAELKGILRNTLYELDIPHKVCPTNTWRHHCGVKGRTRADKKTSMKLLVKQWYDITITDDEADAIGIGKYISDIDKKENIELEIWE